MVFSLRFPLWLLRCEHNLSGVMLTMGILWWICPSTIFYGDNMENTIDIIMEIDSKIDEFFAELCEEYGIVVNMNDLNWDFIE